MWTRPCLRDATLVGAIVVTACCAPHENAIARVDGHDIDVQTFQSYVEAVTEQEWESVDARVAVRLLDQFIDQEVVAAAVGGQSTSMPVEPSERSSALRRLLDDACGPPPTIAAPALEEETDRQLAVLQQARVRVRQILVDSAETAAAVSERLIAGEDFLLVSREMSEAPNASDGGVIGLLSPGTLTRDLDEVIFSLGPGEFSEPIEGPGGYHIFQVLEVIPEGAADHRAAGAAALDALRAHLARDHVRGCIERLALDVGARIHVDHLWFDYDGRYVEADHVPAG
jgi:parvulin-like peptidyl-prolyl isomerase